MQRKTIANNPIELVFQIRNQIKEKLLKNQQVKSTNFYTEKQHLEIQSNIESLLSKLKTIHHYFLLVMN
jgi:hypothetical protein